MPEDDETNTNLGNTSPQGMEPIAPSGGAASQNGESGTTPHDVSKRARHRLIEAVTRLDANQWLTLVLAAVSAVIAYASYRNSADTSDIKRAVTGLADLARQTKRQADIQGSQLALLKGQRVALFRQADAAADSAKAAKDTAAAAKGQTGAIIKQADALIRGAQATITAADAELASAQANIKTAEAGARAAEANQHSAELFASTRAPDAKLSSVELIGWTDAAQPDGNIKIKVKPAFTNTGGGTLLPGITTFSIIISDMAHTDMVKGHQLAFGGNSNPIAPNISFSPNPPFAVTFKKADVDLVNANKKVVLVWGRIPFGDTTGHTYQTCYLAVVQPPSDLAPTGAVRSADVAGAQCTDW